MSSVVKARAYLFRPSLFELEFSIPCKLKSPDKFNGSLMEFNDIIIQIVVPNISADTKIPP